MQCRAGGGFHPDASAASNGGSNELGLDSLALTPMQRGAASVSGLNVAKRGAMVASATRSWQAPNEMQSSVDSLPQGATLADPFAGAEVKGSPGGTSAQAPSAAPTDAGTRSMESPESTLGTASNVGGPLNDSGWSDPLSADSVSSSGGPASDDGRTYPPTQEEIANALSIGVSNSGEASATTVATVANASDWGQFSSSPTSPSTSASASPSAVGSEVNAVATDATDDQIDNAIRKVKAEKGALSNILSSNEASEKITDQGIEVYGSVAHQMNHVINDADSSGIFSTSWSGNGASTEQIDSDVAGFGPAIGNALGNAIPGYKYLNAINQDLTNLQSSVTKKVESISCLFSFDPYCRK
jgi:hypothetical protein